MYGIPILNWCSSKKAKEEFAATTVNLEEFVNDTAQEEESEGKEGEDLERGEESEEENKHLNNCFKKFWYHNTSEHEQSL